MASAIGQTAGKAIYIQEIDYGNNMMMGRMAGMASNVSMKVSSADIAVPDIEFEKIKLEYQVNAKFELN